MIDKVIAGSIEKRSVADTRRPQCSLLTRRQVADRLGVCSHTVQRLTRKGLLAALVFNRRLIRYTPEAVDAFIMGATVRQTRAAKDSQ